MYVIKNAWRNVTRAKVRSSLMVLIVIIIAFAVCVSLCIKEAAVSSKEATLSEMTITAQISPDRSAAMDRTMGDGKPEDFDRDKLKENMVDSLSLAEMKKYAEAESVDSFYYTMTVSANGTDAFEAFTTEESSDMQTGDMGGRDFGKGMNSGDFSITGYSSDDAMTDFVDGICTIKEGAVFDEGTKKKVCIISDELATYNNLEVGDKIKVCSTSDENETFSLEIVGIYSNSQSSAQASTPGMGGGMGRGGFVDPANNIYTSYNTLANIIEDNDAFSGRVSGTYVLGTIEAYEAFQKEVKDLGLSDDYMVSSMDLESYERSSQSLESLAKFAGYFLLVVLVIGAIILTVINMFAVRERKYEIGVLTAIGMKKEKVASLFVSENLIVTLAGVIVGGIAGAVTANPIAKALLSSQMASRQDAFNGMNQAFGRDFGNMGGEIGRAHV